ncbi:MAG: nitrogen regulation protein NR(I) [Pseudomonadota bacterium]
MFRHRVWVIDDDDSIRWVLERALDKAGYDVIGFTNTADAHLALGDQLPHVVISDVRMPGESGLDFLAHLNKAHPELPVIIITAHSDLDNTVSAYEGGAFDYLPKPFDLDDVIKVVSRACELYKSAPSDATQESPDSDSGSVPELIGEAPAMQSVFRAIGRLARSNMTVLITGESGSGKELIARALHRHSPRVNGEFIALNVAAIPTDLIESELFGHEKGAFTGAHSQRRGRFEQADGGTLFLDEIGDMPLPLQTRLLRVLAEGQFYRVGGHTPVSVDVRIVTATHRDLEAQVEQHHFREDLFHRLNVIRIEVPPLRERRDDIPPLLDHFLARAASELNVEPKKAGSELTAYLQALDWQGNVRQLENLCRWLTVMAPGKRISIVDLPADLKSAETSSAEDDWQVALRDWLKGRLDSGGDKILASTVPVFEKIMIECAMQKTRNNRQQAAKLLGWGRNTLTRKMKELQM